MTISPGRIDSTRGHVFVARASLLNLACDDIVVPTDQSLQLTPHWAMVLPDGREPVIDDLDVDSATWQKRRFACIRASGRDGPRVWLVDTGGTGHEPTSWYTDALRGVLVAIADQRHRPCHRRERRLTALPLVGVGAGGAGARRGHVIAEILGLLEERAEVGQDTALVLWTERDHAAVQHVRRQRQPSRTDDEQTAAESLAQHARSGRLALFLGAGVSASAGLPLWDELLGALLDRAGTSAEDRAAVMRLDARDAATLAVRELHQHGVTLPQALRDVLPHRRYGLAHALLASLPVEQVVTTNYDALFEAARHDQGQPVPVLPFEEPDRSWLLKLHGDLAHDDGIVLTREDYLRFGERSGALAGVVQGMLMTKHVLFAGFSFTDENFFRMAHETRAALAAVGRGSSLIGTALELIGDPVKQRLWAGELDYVAMAQPGTSVATAARRLESLLDDVARLAADDQSFLLDPTYDSLKSDADRALAEGLRRLDVSHPLLDDLRRRLGGPRTT